MPKQKITKDMIVNTAFAIARKSGIDSVMVKTIAEALGCSVQPIYSYCSNIEGLRESVNDKMKQFVEEFISTRIDPENLFQSTGRAYIQLAKEEPHIFQMFILHQRRGITSLNDLYSSETNPHIPEIIAKQLHISVSQTRALHLNMLIYTIGIGTIYCVTTPGISAEEIFAQQESAYQAFLQQALNHCQ